MRSPGPMRRVPRAAPSPQNGDLARSRTGGQAFFLNVVEADFYDVRQKSFKDHSFE
jgi:hypothetical protein